MPALEPCEWWANNGNGIVDFASINDQVTSGGESNYFVANGPGLDGDGALALVSEPCSFDAGDTVNGTFTAGGISIAGSFAWGPAGLQASWVTVDATLHPL